MGKLDFEMRSSLLFILALAAAIHSFAQRKTVHDVAGQVAIVNITPEEARQKAIEQAKAEALRLAGAEEWVQSFDFLEKKEDHKKFDEYFHSLTSVQSMGNVVEWKLVNEEKKIDEFKNLVYEVHIDATVELYKTRPDPEFQVAIGDLRMVYRNLDKMNFNITPTKDGYLKIFLLDEARNIAVLFPNEHEPTAAVSAKQVYTFPRNKHYNYEVFTDKDHEVNYLFFVYTRKDIPYGGDQTFAKFIEYIYTIEPAERFLKVERISIYK